MPIELYQEILERSDFKCQIRLTQLNNCLYNNLRIYDLFNIDECYSKLLSDNILKNYKYIKKLDAHSNLNITDEGISHMNLHTLSALNNSKITDDGIKHMNLHILYASSNSKITDDGIKHMTNLELKIII